MTKHQTEILKGVAILMMIFLHLFRNVGVNYEGLCEPLIYVGDIPLVNLLSNACNPVPFFVFLSGYGLSYTWNHKRNDIRQQGKRVLKLYITYWLILLVFVPIGCFVRPDQYPGDELNIILNILAVKCTWNYEIWFLFPYVLLSLSSNAIFRIMKKMKDVPSVVVAFVITMFSGFIISKLVSKGIDMGLFLGTALAYLGLLFPFVFGAWFHHAVEKGRKLLDMKPLYAGIFLIMLFVAECNLPTQADNSIYAILFILLFLNLPYKNVVGNFLWQMGRLSMPMWMIHTFFSAYLFSDFIYSFRYPIIIYIVLILITYISSLVIHRIIQSKIVKQLIWN